MPSSTKRLIVCTALVFFTATPGFATWDIDGYEDVPVTRLIRNLQRRVEQHPKSADAHYALARVHSLAYSATRDALLARVDKTSDGQRASAVDDPDADATVIHAWYPIVGDVRPGLSLERAQHFHSAVRHYRSAIRLKRRLAPAHLGLAWLLDDGTRFATQLKWPGGGNLGVAAGTQWDAERGVQQVLRSNSGLGRVEASEGLLSLGVSALPAVAAAFDDAPARAKQSLRFVIDALWRDLALEAYVRAFRLALSSDLEADAFDLEGDVVSEEAAEAILRLTTGSELTQRLRELRGEARRALKELDGKERYVTPVVFPVESDVVLEDLFRVERSASFDLDGDGSPETWPWPGSGACFLVWKPRPATPITSGRQLFGSRTWWIIWRNGYEPLAALDDDQSGALEGIELEGIGVWRDHNSNAHEDAGEVVSAADFGVISIDVTPDGRWSGVPHSEHGIRLSDGTTRPSYDWTPRSLGDGPDTDVDTRETKRR